MVSGGYGVVPQVCRLRSTDGDVIDLLDKDGICIVHPGWIPGVTELKGGGVRVASQSLDSESLVAGGYGNVTEEFPIQIDATDVAERVEEMMALLWKAEAYSLRGWQRDAVYLEVRLFEDKGFRYSRISTGAFQFGDRSFGRTVGLPTNTLVLEREPYWHGNVPGEMTGPFANMAKNPSFEYWHYEGIDDALPDGWWETVVGGEFPANHEARREEVQVAGDVYALEMNFTGVVSETNPEWYLWQRVRLRETSTYTIRFWLYIENGTAPEQFFVRITDSTGATVYLNQGYTVSPAGNWVHLTFTTDTVAYPYCLLEIGWLCAPGTTGTSRAVIDRIFLLRDTWTLTGWPGDFYMGSSVLWSVWDPEDYSFTPVEAYPVHMNNCLDVWQVPGDVDADTRFAFSHITGEATEENVGFYRIIDAGLFLKKGESSPETRRDPAGFLDTSTFFYVGSDRVNWGVTSTGWSTIYTFQVNGPEVTEKMLNQYRVFIRVRIAAPSPARTWEFRLKSWIGDPTNETQFDVVSELFAAGTSYLHMVHLTPRVAMDWGIPPGATRPASLGFAIEVRYPAWSEGTDYMALDCVFLGPVDQGLVWASCDPGISYAQGLILDTKDSMLPVSKGFARYSDVEPRNVDRYPTASRVYDGKLFLASNDLLGNTVELYYYEPVNEWTSLWQYGGAAASPVINDFEVFDNYLYFVTAAGTIFHHYPGRATPYAIDRTVGGTPNLYYIQQFGGWLFIAAADGWVYRWDGNPATAEAQVYDMQTNQSEDPLCMEFYKHQLWVGGTGGVTAIYTTAGGWVAGTAVPDGNDILWLKNFRDRLYALTDVGNVYTWNGDTWTLSRTGNNAVDGFPHKMIDYDEKLYVLTGNDAAFQSINLFSTPDGLTWTQEVGVQLAAAAATDYGTMDAYCGRIFCATAAYTTTRRGHLWHAPVLAKLTIPDYTGTAFRLSPAAKNRVYAIWTNWLAVAGGDPWTFYREREAVATAKVWFDPRWRSLRGD